MTIQNKKIRRRHAQAPTTPPEAVAIDRAKLALR
jgi:hypothetical protein